jgi:stage II sporulation protein D
MKKRRLFTPSFSLIAVVSVIILVIPALLVMPFSDQKSVDHEGDKPQEAKQEMILDSTVSIPVFRMKQNTVQSIGLEQYVKGVVASEMPATFELEALKAQALSARTYIINHLVNPTDIKLPDNAIVTDSVQHQVYSSDEELKKIWGNEYEWKMDKVTRAVFETKDKVIVYDEKPIAAQFFSTSNGYTENSEDYWQSAFPYLKSVESPWDKQSPKFHHEKELSVQEVQKLLGVSISGTGEIGEVTELTAGKRIGKIIIGNKQFTGREVREKLGLSSSDFVMERESDTVVIKSKGFGHGVGMSQYGANGMAKEGKTYEDIVKHYYKGVSIQDSSVYTANLSAKNN